MSFSRRLKVLVSAFNFSPVRGTEFAVGWDHVRAIASCSRVWVIARANEKDETEQYLRSQPEIARNISVRYIYFSSTEFNYPFWEIQYYWQYRRWQRKALLLARDLDKEVGFDLIHQVTGTGFREPGELWRIGKPFVWGPMGGLQYFPVHLMNAIPFSSRPFFLMKNVSTYLQMHFAPRPRMAAKHAAAIIADTSEVVERVRRIWGRDAALMNEVHAPEGFAPPVRREPTQAFRIVWAGSMAPGKALNLVLMALGKLKDARFPWELVCLGSGVCEPTWKQLIARLGIADRCRLLGRHSRADTLKVMAGGHCFVQPSLYDATSSVVVEALALGLPVVCLEHCGFRDVVRPEYGVLIPASSVESIVNGFADALASLAQDEDMRYRMALEAQRASALYTWRAKARRLNELYENLVPI